MNLGVDLVYLFHDWLHMVATLELKGRQKEVGPLDFCPRYPGTGARKAHAQACPGRSVESWLQGGEVRFDFLNAKYIWIFGLWVTTEGPRAYIIRFICFSRLILRLGLSLYRERHNSVNGFFCCIGPVTSGIATAAERNTVTVIS